MRALTTLLVLTATVSVFAQVTKQERAGIVNFSKVDAVVACGGATDTSALEGLAKDNPSLHQRLASTMRAAQPRGEMPRVAVPVLPIEPIIKQGDRVRYQGTVHEAQYVVHRHGETVVQLKGQAGFVPVSKLQPA